MLSDNEEENNPQLASTWPANRTLHADVLLWLCTDAEASRKISYRGLRLQGMRIEGDLDLTEARLDFSFSANRCAFDSGINLNGTRLRGSTLMAVSSKA